ncbi:Heavy-metal-associated domain (N-terminus) and membrane-bounded cytochrome biogenesis cycZ-like domain, possible membrane copper tolerance protein [Marinobacterium lacunae]|uniref:Heavy-metal-associated domain (N-terminus) and membrane-bounded cytochrome biogenesis cycZ-like domain, possible membrane copper tolerance protein n=1 Tax=Marinobacterium lacunae TaxID=1232683 RepID=A0A081FW75_9GAMM|nr:Heavy-metal-associated domain (N-terminus) and membrane-bounded cytochrome biogenesis cycZ-like domain, possible membrane copper tolerance protein [Marinobacterium lacunae]
MGMCGGLAASVSMGAPGSQRGFWLILAYNIGRISSYAAAGALIGLVGFQLKNSGAGIALRTLAGVLLIAMGLYVAQWWQVLTRLEQAGGLLWRHLRPIAARFLPADTLPRALTLGILWGWLPCGLVYSTLLWSSAAGHWLDSALLMIGFGIGTLPAMLTTGLLAQQVRALMQKQGLRRGAGILIILFGLYTLPLASVVDSL